MDNPNLAIALFQEQERTCKQYLSSMKILGCMLCSSALQSESMKFWKRNVKIEGFIASYSLQDWWISTFTDEERLYIDNSYQPMGLPPHTLTKGKWDTSKPASQFLQYLRISKCQAYLMVTQMKLPYIRLSERRIVIREMGLKEWIKKLSFRDV